MYYAAEQLHGGDSLVLVLWEDSMCFALLRHGYS